ncbi:MAG: CARDB domain-containing protein [bacterium]|nr:CARDB domain-containing protein [bacterium]
MEPINQLKRDTLEFKQDDLAHKKAALKERIKARLGKHANKATDILAIIGSVAILVLFVIGAVYTVKYAGVALRSVGAAAVTLSSKFFPREELVPTVDAEKIISGAPFVISWEKKNIKVSGSHSLYYPCVEGLFLKAQTPDSDTQNILCNKDFDFNNYDNRLTLTAASSKFNKVDLPITIKFTENGKSNPSISGVINVSIINDAIKSSGDDVLIVIKDNDSTVTTGNTIGGGTYTVTNPGKTTSNTYNINGGSNSPVNNPNGHPDLRPAILETGYLDSDNNFVSTSTPMRSNRIAVRFKIENIGDKTSSTFRFNVYLPTYPSQIFNSDEQMGINVGERVEYTIAFDKALQGSQTFRIFVDPAQNVTSELNRNNNDLSTMINIQ